MQNPPQKPKISVFALGGTICMQPGQNGGVTPALDAAQLAAAAALDGYEISAQTLALLPSPSLEIAHVIAAVNAAKSAILQGAAGCVITQGTDTLAQSAYLASLLFDAPGALVFTGAMRSPGELSADGAANLHAAVCAAATAPRGVYLCANDILLAPRWAAKAHSSALQAFAPVSDAGAARFFEGKWRYLERAQSACGRFAHAASALSTAAPRVLIYTPVLGDDGELLRAIVAGDLALSALVINGLGAGHVSAANAQLVGKISAKMPVAIASACASGMAALNTYGYEGSELHLRRLGAIMAADLGAQNARILLMCALAANCSREQIAEIFAAEYLY